MENTPITYEKLQEGIAEGKEYPFSIMHYGFLFRRFDVIWENIQNLTDAELKEKMKEGAEACGEEWITPMHCAAWNMNYIIAYDEKHRTEIKKRLEKVCGINESHRPLLEYTDIVDRNNNKSVFDIVWGKQQPMLDVIYYERQLIAAEQVRRHRYSIVLDEVGTGKTVTALYAARDVIEEAQKDGRMAKILIICPHNKRMDWQNDVRRQLGRYAHIVDQSDAGELYDGRRKNAFFRKDEHMIFICGQKQGQDKNGSSSALKGTMEVYAKGDDWDLVIIDEAHLSFDNYKDVRGTRVVLLTATPIVISANKGIRKIEDYSSLAKNIICPPCKETQNVDPIHVTDPQEDNCFVNWFREDMGRESVERKIKFEECERETWRETLFSAIEDKKGRLAALTYDQDDAYLLKNALKMEKDSELDSKIELPKSLPHNKKIEKLLDCLRNNRKSYLIFCEHKAVAYAIYDEIKKEQNLSDVIAIKTGSGEDNVGLNQVQEGQLLNCSIQALRDGKRVLLVLTGKIGGTGLNLGEFDGVIHYELPFTSIELEQRFGRIDRIDSSKNKTGDMEKEMIFLLNEKGDNSDSVANRMLYYCTTKIDITCQYMPIRNTVLFRPEVIEREKEGFRETFTYFSKSPILQREEYVQRYENALKEKERKIKELPEWKEALAKGGENKKDDFLRRCNDILNSQLEEDSEELTEFYQKLSEYIGEAENEEWQKQWEEFREEKKRFWKEKKNAERWLAAIGYAAVAADSELFFAATEDSEQLGDEGESDADKKSDTEDDIVSKLSDEEEEETEDKKESNKAETIREQCLAMLEEISQVDIEKIQLSGMYTEGIFWFENGKIQRATVKEYREGHSEE